MPRNRRTPQTSLGALIRKARELAGLSQEELASRLGYRAPGAQSAISQLELGDPTLRTLRRAARACGFRVRVILEREGTEGKS